MIKRLLLSLSAMLLVASAGVAQAPFAKQRVKTTQPKVEKTALTVRTLHGKAMKAPAMSADESNGGIIETVVLAEDFSRFTEGSVGAPDSKRLDESETGIIEDSYFNAPGWVGVEVYQAGGSAYITFSEELNETGMLISPLINTEGCISIKCRVKSDNPEGDWIGYNINDENYEVYDANFYQVYDDQWTEIEWFTSFGCDNSYLYIYAYESNVYIDDIVVTRYDMSVPTLLPETDVTDTSFTINWNEVEGADAYQLFVYADHTAIADETYYVSDVDFNDIVSDGTPENPEVTDAYEFEYAGWYAYLPVFINGAIGLSGEYASWGEYSYCTSPEYDLSSDGGKFTVKLRMKGNPGESVDLCLYAASDGEMYDTFNTQPIQIESDEWEDYTFVMEGGSVLSMIDIIYYGATNLFIDSIVVTQEMKSGEQKTSIIYQAVEQGSGVTINVNEHNRADQISYELYAIKYYIIDDYIAGGIYSDTTERRYVTLNSSAITEIEGESSANAYFANGQLYVVNPEDEDVAIYNINGTCIYNAAVSGCVGVNFAQGAYIVKVGNKTLKAVNI